MHDLIFYALPCFVCAVCFVMLGYHAGYKDGKRDERERQTIIEN